MAGINGVIGVVGADLARYGVFYDSLLMLAKPQGTALVPTHGASPAENRNIITEQALSLGAEWIFYLDDDQVLAPDTLLRLLRHDKDVVSGLYVSREPPFIPHVYDKEDERGWVMPRLLEPNDGGIHKVLATGAGCMLVKTRVFEKLEKPWWTIGQIVKDGWGDDVDFCRRVRAAGFEVWADLDALVGHSMHGTLWPTRGADGLWSTAFLYGNKGAIAEWPAAQAEPLKAVI
jgi:hypothetical protein